MIVSLSFLLQDLLKTKNTLWNLHFFVRRREMILAQLPVLPPALIIYWYWEVSCLDQEQT